MIELRVEPKVYASIFKEILGAVNEAMRDELSDDEIFQLACAVLEEIARDRRTSWIQEQRGPRAEKPAAEQKWRADPASPEQLDLLTKNKIPFTWPITKGQASDLIDELTKKWKGKKA